MLPGCMQLRIRMSILAARRPACRPAFSIFRIILTNHVLGADYPAHYCLGVSGNGEHGEEVERCGCRHVQIDFCRTSAIYCGTSARKIINWQETSTVGRNHGHARLWHPYVLLQMLADFFDHHSHCTIFRDQQSSLLEITASIIQGSAIGPAVW